jgi:hypothetical protein
MSIADTVSMLPDWFRRTRAGAAAVAEAEQAETDERRRLIAELKAVESSLPALAKSHAAIIEKAKAAVLKAEQAFIDSKQAYHRAIAAKSAALGTPEIKIAQIKRQLAELCPPEVESLRQELLAMLDETRKHGLEVESWTEHRRGLPHYTGTSNRAALTARIQAIVAALNEGIPSLALIDPAKMDDAIAEIRASIPECKGRYDSPVPTTAVLQDASAALLAVR